MDGVNKISSLSKGLLILAALLFIGTIFLPFWKIDLVAPQYPEGLALLIYADKLAGDVDIINGLNHYIGMATLHTEDFVEFAILRYILGFFVLFILVTALIGKRKMVNILFFSFLSFGLLALADFYRWNYNYGHNLDPSAAIIVPGMSYQPPVFGYKQLLNFGAYSMPNSGGILFILTGLIILFVVLFEANVFKKIFKGKVKIALLLVIGSQLALLSCSAPGPRPLNLNRDMCAYCKMTITDAIFAAQLTTQQGRQYLFDDVACMLAYTKENPDLKYNKFYVSDICDATAFIDVELATFLSDEDFRSPMGGNIGAFANQDSAAYYKVKYNATEVFWKDLIK
jgi:copper chaperone NosL